MTIYDVTRNSLHMDLIMTHSHATAAIEKKLLVTGENERIENVWLEMILGVLHEKSDLWRHLATHVAQC